MAYAAASDVAGWCKDILGGRDNFTSSTCPTLDEVDNWLSSGCAVLETVLTSKGYSAGVASTTVAYGWLKDLNALYAAARAEFSRITSTVAPDERTKGQVYQELFDKQLNMMLKFNLSGAGIGRSSAGKLYIGGISQSDKDTYDGDTDRVPARFRKGLFGFPGTIRPDVTTGS